MDEMKKRREKKTDVFHNYHSEEFFAPLTLECIPMHMCGALRPNCMVPGVKVRWSSTVLVLPGRNLSKTTEILDKFWS